MSFSAGTCDENWLAGSLQTDACSVDDAVSPSGNFIACVGRVVERHGSGDIFPWSVAGSDRAFVHYGNPGESTCGKSELSADGYAFSSLADEHQDADSDGYFNPNHHLHCHSYRNGISDRYRHISPAHHN
jgi:hypothetical protein